MRAWLAILAAASLLAAQTTPGTQANEPRADRNNGLRIEVVEGQGAINNITKGTAWEPVVQVLDDAGSPVQDAVVTFVLPGMGPGAAFTDGSKMLNVQSDESGRAVAKGMRPNTVAGQFEIRVTATSNGRSGARDDHADQRGARGGGGQEVEQGSDHPYRGRRRRCRRDSGRDAGKEGPSPSTPNPPTTTPGTVTPGQPGFGAPH